MSEEMQKLLEHDEIFKSIDKRFDEVDRRFEQVDRRFDSVEGRLDRVESQVELIAQKVLEHDGRLERIEQNMATKDDINDIKNILDRLVKANETTLQELAAMGYRQTLLENKVEVHDKEIVRIKTAIRI